MQPTRNPVEFELRRHHRIRPASLHASLVSESTPVGSGRVRDLSLGGMLVENAPALRLGERVWSRLISGGKSRFGVSGVVVRRDTRGVAIRFASLAKAALDHLQKLVLNEQIRATDSLTLVAHRSREEGHIIIAMLARAGQPAVHVRTPLELVVALEKNMVVSSLLVDEFFWGGDLETHSRFLAEIYPDLSMSLLVRSCSQDPGPRSVFQHVARKPWHVDHLCDLASANTRS